MNMPLPASLYKGNASKTNKAVLPITLAILGASVALMAVMLIQSEKPRAADGGNYEVENYDVVDNMPFIYSICE